MTTIVIAGAGFAGLAAAREAARLTTRDAVAIRVLDARPYTTMIPSLPDLAGGRLDKGYMKGDLRDLLPKGVELRQETVKALDFRGRRVITATGAVPYDRLIVALGSTTDFRGFSQHRDRIYTCDSLEETDRLRRDFLRHVQSRPAPAAVIAGGGYTGLELAVNLRAAGCRAGKDPRVLVAEHAPSLLPFMPDWVRRYMERLAREAGIETALSAVVSGFDGGTVTLSNGLVIDDAFLCWATGTRFPVTDLRGDAEQLPDGRLVVDAELRLPAHPEVLAAGDSAALKAGDRVLRKAVNFARDSGFAAGRNAAASVQGRPLKPFKPVDLGWIIPFGHAGIGELFSRMPVRGRLALALHYAMCGLRNYSARNTLFYGRLALACLVRPRPRFARGGR